MTGWCFLFSLLLRTLVPRAAILLNVFWLIDLSLLLVADLWVIDLCMRGILFASSPLLWLLVMLFSRDCFLDPLSFDAFLFFFFFSKLSIFFSKSLKVYFASLSFDMSLDTSLECSRSRDALLPDFNLLILWSAGNFLPVPVVSKMELLFSVMGFSIDLV